MPIKYHHVEIVRPVFKRRLLSECLSDLIMGKNKLIGVINVIFTSDSFLLEMNKEHLDHDYFTDVITFDFCESNFVSGDIYISRDRLLENAKSFSVSFEKELVRVVAHGVLHLLGFDDKNDLDKKKMTQQEERFIKKWHSKQIHAE